MINQPKIIFIDWYQTLSNSLFWEHLQDVNHSYNKYFEAIEKSMFQNNRHLINPWMRGEHTSEDMTQILSENSGVPQDIILNELAESCRNMKFVSDEIPELINKIKSKEIKVVIATDNMDTFERFTIPAMKLEELFDDFLISHSLELLKGDVQENSISFFDEYLNKHNLNYQDVVLLDDCVDDTGTYDRLGLSIIQIASPEKLVNVLKEYAF
jgi:FMN phosphatase YigB (HAD superfamily)